MTMVTKWLMRTAKGYDTKNGTGLLPFVVAKDMFPGYSPASLLGAKKKVICVDFSVGVRYEERGMSLSAEFGEADTEDTASD